MSDLARGVIQAVLEGIRETGDEGMPGGPLLRIADGVRV